MTGVYHYDLAIPLKGGRTYVRGADLYSAIAAIVEGKWPDASGRCRLNFRHFPRSALRIFCGENARIPPSAQKPLADFSIGRSQGDIVGWIEELPEPIVVAEPFDEDALIGEVRMQADTISPVGARACAPIDLAVALTKALHNRNRPVAGGKWVFTRLDIARPLRPGDTDSMSIALVSGSGPRLTRSEIRSGEGAIGSIFFSVAQP